MSAWDTPAADLVALNFWHRDLHILVGELHDIGFDDPEEALVKLDGIAGIASEWRALVQRRAQEHADLRARVEQDSTPGPDLSWVMNGGR